MEKQVERINTAELSAILQNEKTVQGCTFAGFDALVEMDLAGTLNGDRKQKNPDKGRVFKVLTNQLGILNSNTNGSAYGASVNRRLVESGLEPNFVPQAPSWGTRLPGTAFMHHTKADTKEYNEYFCIIFRQSRVALVDYVAKMGIKLSDDDRAIIEAMTRKVGGYESKHGDTKYVRKDDSGVLVPIEWDAIQGKKDKPKEARQGGLEDDMKVIYRTFKLSGIERIAIGGKVYLIG